MNDIRRDNASWEIFQLKKRTKNKEQRIKNKEQRKSGCYQLLR